jgi:hypothetical protein
MYQKTAQHGGVMGNFSKHTEVLRFTSSSISCLNSVPSLEGLHRSRSDSLPCDKRHILRVRKSLRPRFESSPILALVQLIPSMGWLTVTPAQEKDILEAGHVQARTLSPHLQKR